MIAFAALLERLVFTPSRNAKIALMRRYFAAQPDPDRGIGLAAITGELSFTAAKPGSANWPWPVLILFCSTGHTTTSAICRKRSP